MNPSTIALLGIDMELGSISLREDGALETTLLSIGEIACSISHLLDAMSLEGEGYLLA